MNSDAKNNGRDEASQQTFPPDGEGALVHLQSASALIGQGELEEATRQARLAARRVSRDSPNLERLGVLLFELGQFFPEAYTVLDQAARNGPLGARALTMAAALYHRRGETDKERRCMAAFAREEAVIGPYQPNPDLPRVLRLRSVEKSFFGIKTKRRTGLRHVWLKGGHFSDRHLTDSRRINLYVATVFGNNLDSVNNLPDFDLFMNAVSCADLDPDGLDRIEEFLCQYPGAPVINPPAKVRLTTRAENYRRLNELQGVRMPRTSLYSLERPPGELALEIEAAGFTYPLIVRHQGTQTGKTVRKIDSRTELQGWLSEQPTATQIYVISYVDCQGDDGYYRKTRAFFIDGEFYPVANLCSDSWQIHSGDRYRVMSSTPSTQEEEQRYLKDPATFVGEKAFNALHSIRDVVALDFFGIDFTLDPEGNVLVFEANAAMRHNFDHAESFPYTRPYLQRISEAFAAMLDRRTGRRAVSDSSPRETVSGATDAVAVPRVHLAGFLSDDGILAPDARERLVATLIAGLRKAPYWLVLATDQDPIAVKMLEELLREIGNAGLPPDQEPQRISRTKVRVDPEQAARQGAVTRYSRTPEALPLHTDCSNQSNPPNLVAFAMERPDARGGGVSTMLSARDLLADMPSELEALLREPVFPFSRRECRPILEGEGEGVSIRYYRKQIDSFVAAAASPEEVNAILERLDAHIESSPRTAQFSMQPGEVLMMDNRRVLHGRGSMPVDSDRLMHRFRLFSAALLGDAD